MKTFISIILLSLFLAGCATIQDFFKEDYKPYGIKATAESRSCYVEQHPELPEIIKNDILNGTIRQGMTREQVIASWGEPDFIYEMDKGIMFSYGGAAPPAHELMTDFPNLSQPRTLLLFFRKRSILKGIEESLVGWSPENIDYAIYPEEPEPPGLKINVEF